MNGRQLPWGLAAFPAAGLAAVCLVPFLRRAAGAVPDGLPVGEACVSTAAATFAAAALAGAVLHSARHRTGIAFALGLTFAAGVAAEPATFLPCLLTTLAVAGLGVAPLPEAAHRVARPKDEVRDSDDHAHRSGSRPAGFGPAALADSAVGVLATNDSPDAAEVASGTAGEALPGSSVVRSSDADGERIEAVLPVEFPPGETVRTLHLPLWPPLAGEPEVECGLDGLEGRVRVPFARAYGLRVEVRLSEPCDEPLEGAVRVTARARAGGRSAA